MLLSAAAYVSQGQSIEAELQAAWIIPGTLPSSWGRLPLQRVELQGNLLEGPVPTSWQRLAACICDVKI